MGDRQQEREEEEEEEGKEEEEGEERKRKSWEDEWENRRGRQRRRIKQDNVINERENGRRKGGHVHCTCIIQCTRVILIPITTKCGRGSWE